MSTTKRDYYELLGVGRDADEGEIKRAFRRRARELHPDVSGAPDAEQRFREVVEAYEVLSNGERRQLYDRFGHDGLRSGGFQPSTFDLGDLSDLFSAFFGDDLFGVARGAGRGLEERRLEVEIPAGIHDGQRIRLSGEGHAGLLGGRAGDVYVEVRVRPDERFVREGNDVYTTVDLTLPQAALGATVQVPTLDGETQLTFEPGTQSGAVRVLRARGFPVLRGFGRGDLRVMVNVLVPRHLTPEQRRLLEEFERLSSEETYRADEGFFEKLKSAFR